jgi:hypothetical protein
MRSGLSELPTRQIHAMKLVESNANGSVTICLRLSVTW